MDAKKEILAAIKELYRLIGKGDDICLRVKNPELAKNSYPKVVYQYGARIHLGKLLFDFLRKELNRFVEFVEAINSPEESDRKEAKKSLDAYRPSYLEAFLRGEETDLSDLFDFSEEESGTDSGDESNAVSPTTSTATTSDGATTSHGSSVFDEHFKESDSPVNKPASFFSGLFSCLFFQRAQRRQRGEREPLLNKEAGVELVRHPLNDAS